MEYRRLRLQVSHNVLQRALNGLLILLWLQAMGVGFASKAVAQSRPCSGYDKPAVLYTGKTYGYLRANDPVRPDGGASAASVFDEAYRHVYDDLCLRPILVGMGDNLAPEYGSRLKITPNPDESKFIERLELPWSRIPLQWPPLPGPWPGVEQSPAALFFKGERCTKNPTDNKLICDLRKRPYDALVPGQLDFYFGADFLVRAGTEGELPMLGANLTIQNTKQVPQPQPTCAQPQLLLPTQVSLPIQSSGGSGGGKGKGKGKGGGGGGTGGSAGAGGGSSQGAAGSASGQSGSGQSGQTCLQPESPDSENPKNLKLASPSADSVYPWSSEFEFSLPAGSTKPTDPYLCPWRASRVGPKANTSDVNTESCILLAEPKEIKKEEEATTSAAADDKKRPQDKQKKQDNKNTFISLVSYKNIPINDDGLPKPAAAPAKTPPNSGTTITPLIPDTDVQLCVTVTVPDDKHPDETKLQVVCTSTPLHVLHPFFPRAWVTVTRGGVNYAIFGALDPALTGLISPENSSFGNTDKYTSQIKISDPAPALEQLRTTFQRLHPDKSWTYVLLAQMPRAAAQAVSASLQWTQEHLTADLQKDHFYHFDVILSAADYNEATPDMELTLHQHDRPTPVVTPYPIVTGSTMRNPLALLEVDNSDRRRTKYINHTDQDPDPKPVIVKGGTLSAACGIYKPIHDLLAACSEQYLKTNMPGIKPYRETNKIDPDTKKKIPRNLCSIAGDAFQCVALEKMRERLDTDIAILQQNDFYEECNYEGPMEPAGGWTSVPTDKMEQIRIQMVDRVLWNSGYLTRVSVSGATLRSILQNSDKIKQQEASSTNEPIVRKQDLVTLGVSKSNGLYFVDGAAVDDNKIYSVATSDQLAFESGAYPQFGQVDLVAPSVFSGWDKETYAIGELAGALSPSSPKVSGLVREKIVAAGPPEMDPIEPPKGPKSIPLASASATELAVQNRNFLTITLQQASIGYTNSRPSQTDANINSNLAGVTNPNVASPHSDSLSYSDAFRLLYQWTAHWNAGFDELITFTRSRQGSLTATSQTTSTGQAVPEESINLSSNSLIASPFIEFQPHRYQGRHWKIVGRPITFSTQLSRTLQFLPSASKTVVYELNLRRQENWQPSVGGRYEKDSLNFFEAGYLNQTARNVLAKLTINGVTTSLTSGTTAAEITMNFTPSGSAATPIYGTFHQQGAYWLGMYTKNFIPKAKNFQLTYQGITYGNFFAYGAVDKTSTALTRYAAELSNNLQIQLWGNISVGPSYNIFWFQSQSHKAGDSLTRGDWNLQLNYMFDWHQGLEWTYALVGKTNQ